MRKVEALCLAILFVLALSAASFAGVGASTTVNGWVTDQKCSAKGASAAAEACTKKCLGAGEKMVIVTDKDQKVLLVDNPDALTEHAGHHVAVTGTVSGDSIHVDSVKMI
jgi:glycerol kinase